VLKTAATGAGVLLGSSAVSGTPVAANESQSAQSSNANHEWLGTWTTSPHDVSALADNQEGFVDQTLRLITHTSRGGDRVRVRLTNAYGDRAMTVPNVTIGIREAGAYLEAGSLRRMTFDGSPGVTIRSGARAASDPVDLAVGPEQDLAVSLYVPGPTGPPTTHLGAFTTSYLTSGNHAGDEHGDDYSGTTTNWYLLEGVDVDRSSPEGAVVCLGDSITDGFGDISTGKSMDMVNTYPGFLGRRLNDNQELQKSVLNAGIGGNRVLRDSPPGAGFGESALDRLDGDILAQPGVSDIILLEGINDIGIPPSASAEAIIEGHKQIIARVHAHGLNIVGATLTPAGYEPGSENEAKRLAVNRFIRTSGDYDGVTDFDAAIRDPNHPERMQPKYDSGDGIHPSIRGYRVMADAVDLSLLQ
jgi:lysophospholipase L1-like esterase